MNEKSADDNDTTTDGNKMGNILNEFFVSVFTKEDTSNLPQKN